MFSSSSQVLSSALKCSWSSSSGSFSCCSSFTSLHNSSYPVFSAFPTLVDLSRTTSGFGSTCTNLLGLRSWYIRRAKSRWTRRRIQNGRSGWIGSDAGMRGETGLGESNEAIVFVRVYPEMFIRAHSTPDGQVVVKHKNRYSNGTRTIPCDLTNYGKLVDPLLASKVIYTCTLCTLFASYYVVATVC